MLVTNNKIEFMAFSYTWTKDSFLSITQIEYALKRLWYLTSGATEWNDGVVISFQAITKEKVNKIFEYNTDDFKWIRISDFIPCDYVCEFDTDTLPALFVNNEDQITFEGAGNYPFDLVAATFIFLTRWEEWAFPVKDQFGRYLESESMAVKQGFHARPVLDEWALMLRPWLKRKNQQWSPKFSNSSISITHDIDHLIYFKSWSRLIRGCLRGLCFQYSMKLALLNIYQGLLSRINYRNDPCYKAITSLVLLHKSLGTNGTFFFMSADKSKYDDGYDINSPVVKNLIEKIKTNGHDVGWHPGFFAAENEALFKEEYIRFKKNCTDPIFGARHHFLRWQPGKSWNRMEDYGILFDSSLGYSQTYGFRCSTAHAFPAFDLVNNKELQLEVRPFALMDSYLLKHPTEVKDIITTLLQRCKNVDGCFSLIVHNYSLMIYPELTGLIRDSLKKAL